MSRADWAKKKTVEAYTSTVNVFSPYHRNVEPSWLEFFFVENTLQPEETVFGPMMVVEEGSAQLFSDCQGMLQHPNRRTKEGV